MVLVEKFEVVVFYFEGLEVDFYYDFFVVREEPERVFFDEFLKVVVLFFWDLEKRPVGVLVLFLEKCSEIFIGYYLDTV